MLPPSRNTQYWVSTVDRLLATSVRSVMAVPLDEPADALQSAFDLFVAAGVAGAHVAFASGAERTARDDGHALFSEEPLAERHTVETGHRDVRKGVERSLRFERG